MVSLIHSSAAVEPSTVRRVRFGTAWVAWIRPVALAGLASGWSVP